MHFFQELFRALKVKQAVYTRVEARSPWGFDFIPYRHTKFGMVLEGNCYIDLKDGREPVYLQAGHCYLLPRGDSFRLRDRAMSKISPFRRRIKASGRPLVALRWQRRENRYHRRPVYICP